MHIYGPAHLHGPQSISAPHTHRAPQVATTPSTSAANDQLDISDAARIAARLTEVPEMRHERVAQLRAAIADGSYETADKLDVAVDRLLNEIA